ncbi:MAG: PQQ-dependent sugar dehydrogenase [Saprospiraceae bacterium]|nr:PQQ-dependent sugar dehydrogenase [Saprospiraceae bacterium]
MQNFVKYLSSVLILLVWQPLSLLAQTAMLPSGFAQAFLAEGLNPTCMAYAPDGRLFLAQKDGRVLILHEDGDLHDEPFITLDVDAFNEKGLNGIAIDPHFESQPWVYLYYTVPGQEHNRVSRVWANGDFAVPGSEQVLLELDQLSGSIHNAGAMVFGPDERLYIGVGDGAKSDNAQELNTVLGKILCIEPNGMIPADNPFYDQLTGINRAIYAYGVRNPFSMSCDPETGKIYFCDVGAEAWEEVNELKPGANYGWKLFQGASGDPAFTDPVFAYNHTDGCAIVGAAFAFHNQALIPDEYRGKFFFADYCKGWIKALDPETGTLIGTFASGVDRPVSLLATPDGALYYLARAGLGGGSEVDNTASDEGAIWKVFWVGEGAPLITSQPQSVLVAESESASFFTQAFGSQPISYQWYLDGAPVPGADSSFLLLDNLSLADSGVLVFCIAQNAFGADTSQTAVVGVSSNKRPEPQILLPLADALYRGGDTLFFSGVAIDPEEGPLSADRLSWKIDFHHADHTHPALPVTPGISEGQYMVGSVGETATDVFFRIYLSARDAQGFEKTVWRDVQPLKTNISIVGPPGIEMNVDGQIRTLPAVFESVVGLSRTIQAPAKQQIGDTVYLFSHWSDGSTDALKVFVTPETPVSLEANFESYTLGHGTGVLGQYFIDPEADFDEAPVVMRTDTTINFNWGNDSPDPQIPSDYFTVRWTGFVQPLFSETYTFDVFSDDGCRLWIGDSLIIDKWEPQAPEEQSGSMLLEAGKKYRLRLEYLEIAGGALAQLRWSSAHQIKQIVPKRQLYPPLYAFPAAVTGNLGLDSNNNGIWDQGEPTFSGATVRLFAAANDSLLFTAFSSTDGRYNFPDLAPGAYYLKIGLPPTADVFLPVQNVDADGFSPVFDLDEGEHLNMNVAWAVTMIALGGNVWLDENHNDLQEATEPLLPDITVLLYRDDSTLVSARMTDAEGQYGFSIVEPGTYFMVFLHQFYPFPLKPAFGLNAQGRTDNFDMAQGQFRIVNVAFFPDTLATGTEEHRNIVLNVYPNPADETLWIASDNMAIRSVRLVDAGGKIVAIRQQVLTPARVQLDLQGLPAGMYGLIVEHEKGVLGRKIIKL